MFDVYLNTSRYDFKRELTVSPYFQNCFQYPSFEKPHPNEFGKFLFGNLTLRILTGKLHKPYNEPPKCHWCQNRCTQITTQENHFRITMCLQCNFCGARGPVLNQSITHINEDEALKKEILDFMTQQYNHIASWDKEIVDNPPSSVIDPDANLS